MFLSLRVSLLRCHPLSLHVCVYVCVSFSLLKQTLFITSYLLFLYVIDIPLGVEYVSTPRSVVISPQIDGVAVELSITPLQEGFLKVTATRCFV